MGTITSGVGLISGLNTKDIIDQLISIESRPVKQLQGRIDSITSQKLAFTDLQTRLSALDLSAKTLSKPSSFKAAVATSGNEDVLTATANNGAAVGSYQFQVARLVTAQQSVSKGFADFKSAKVGAGTLSLSLGGGELDNETQLSDLNGGAGIRRGVFRITDRTGASTTIDTSDSVSVNDVLKKINTSLTVNVRASVDGDKIVLTDLTSATRGSLNVQDVGDGKTATDLGIVGTSLVGAINGTDINFISAQTNLSNLNDGRGIGRGTGGADFQIQLADGSAPLGISLAGKKTLGEVVTLINAANPTGVKATIDAGGNGIKLTDLTGGGGAFTVTNANGSTAARDLGIEKTGTGGVIAGDGILAGINTVLLTSLKGGAGLTLGTIAVQSRAAGAAVDVDLSSAKSVSDVLRLINNSGAGVTAALNDTASGISITDSSGGSGTLVIGESGGTSAADLGIAGTFDSSVAKVTGKNLRRQFVNANTLMADFNGGKGIAKGKFIITNAAGASATIDLTQGDELRIGDVMNEINAKNINVIARINDNGDGLLLTDASVGAGKMKIVDKDGTTAKDLQIAGTATTTTISGSLTKELTIAATDTLADVQKKINDLSFGVNAQIINDGTSNTPYRLTLTATNSGRNGRVMIDGGTTSLGVSTLVDAQNAAVFVGGAGSAQPLLITASKNTLSGVITGVNIDLHSVSSGPVTLNVARSGENVSTQLDTFVTGFNEMVDKIAELTKFDTDTNTRGLLLGDSTVQSVQNGVYAALQTVVSSGGKYRVLADIGLTVVDGAKLAFDADKFNAAYGDDATSVENLFTQTKTALDGKSTATGFAGILDKQIQKLIDPIDGLISRQNKSLDERTTQFQGRITQLNVLIESKRTRLTKQFSNLETVLSGLQNQQKSISGIQSISSSSSK